MSFEFSVLNFAVLMIAAYVAKRDNHIDFCAIFGLGAYLVLLWGMLDFVWRIYHHGVVAAAFP